MSSRRNTPPKRLVVFASGSAHNGDLGFERLVQATDNYELHAHIVAVVSNHENGGVRQQAQKLNVPFIHIPGPFTAEHYQKIAKQTKGEFFALSGWLKLVQGLDPTTNFNSQTVFNIHHGPLPRFGGPGMYGRRVHEAVLAAHKAGEFGKDGSLLQSAITMHFVTAEYNQGPVFFSFRIAILPDDTPQTLRARVNRWEHVYQPKITDLVVTGKIRWDGINPNTLTVPSGYKIEQA